MPVATSTAVRARPMAALFLRSLEPSLGSLKAGRQLEKLQILIRVKYIFDLDSHAVPMFRFTIGFHALPRISIWLKP